MWNEDIAYLNSKQTNTENLISQSLNLLSNVSILNVIFRAIKILNRYYLLSKYNYNYRECRFKKYNI